ncbi:MAG: SdrD B-like domain-containing protein, partial [Vicinamibacterales bacterium]
MVRVILLAAVAAGIGLWLKPPSVSAQSPAATWVCFPSCAPNDGRFLVVAGNDPTTLGGTDVVLNLNVPVTSTGVQFEVFDGDGINPTGFIPNANWDTPANGAEPPELAMELWADPNMTGPGSPTAVLLKTWTSAQAGFINNEWTAFSEPNNVVALDGATYRYAVKFTAENLADAGWNSFKFRTPGTMTLNTQNFSFLATMIAPITSNNDTTIIYPNFPTLTPTTYDGTWRFGIPVAAGQNSITVWDGDFDYGTQNCSIRDSDDPDTLGMPPFTAPGALLEGIAVGDTSASCAAFGGQTTALPWDDSASARFRRSPTRLGLTPGSDGPTGILYEVVSPTGDRFVNLNPTGNREWESFIIKKDTNASTANCLAANDPNRSSYDCVTPNLPGGIYDVYIDGMDLQNLNFWRLPVLGVTPSGPPVGTDAFYSIGRLVWYDTNGNGVRDSGEPGIPGVALRVNDGSGGFQTGTTMVDDPTTPTYDETGEFFFRRAAGTYTVTIDSSNFLPGGPLFGLASTTGGEVSGGLTVGPPDYAEAIFGYVPPVIAVNAQPVCVADAPYVNITVTATNFTPQSGATATLVWKDSLGVVKQTDVLPWTNLSAPLTGQVLWPGAVVDGLGTATDWPGWVFTGGQWVLGSDGFENTRPTVTIEVSVNPTETVTVNYPPPTVSCNASPARPAITLIKKTNNTDNNTAPGLPLLAGDAVTWTYDITNTGNVPLSNIVLTDDKIGGVACPATSLNAGQSMTCSATGTAVAGQYTNIGTVTGTAPEGETVTATDPDNYFAEAPAPSISLIKKTNGTDNNTPTGPVVEVNSTVTWTYEVTNTGNVPLTNVTVTDDKLSGNICVVPTLAPGASTTCSATGTATAGQYANTGFVTGTPPSGPNVTDDDPDHYFGALPSIALIKRTNSTDNNTAPGVFVPTGTMVTWTYDITNTGNVTLTNVTLNDDIEGLIACPVTTLAPGASTTCTKTGTALAGQYTNLGTVTGTPPVGPNVTANDPDNYYGSSPAITLIKRTNNTDNNTAPGIYIPTGDAVTWTYEITNTGNVTLTNLTLSDDKLGSVACPVTTLAAGASTTCSASGIAQAGQYTNLGTVTGTPPVGPNVSANDPDNYFGQSPAISLVKLTNNTDNDTAPGVTVMVGSTVTWTYIVTNTGNVPLTNVTVTDNKLTGNVCVLPSLAVGASDTCTATGTAVAGQYANIGTVTGQPPVGTPVTDTNPDHYNALEYASISGFVYHDSNNDGVKGGAEAPIAGTTVQLTGTDTFGAAVTLTQMTNASGFYEFANLVPGTYTVTETQPAGYLDGKDTQGTPGNGSATNDVFASVTLASGVHGQDNNFGELQAATVSGFVYVDSDNDGVKDAGEAPIAGATVSLSGTDINNAAVTATTTTDAAGYYEFTGLVPGTYTVTEMQPAGYLDGKDTAGSLGGSTATNDVIATIGVPSGGNSQNNNFGELQAAAVSGFVYVDADNDGIKDAGEAPIAGATVSLSGTDVNNAAVSSTTTTDAAGYYEFTGLMPGTYTVTETQPAGYLDGKDTAGSLGGSTTTNDVIATIVVPNGGTSTDNNFGELQAATVSGFVYVDADNDGVKDAGEAPIANTTVALSGTDDLGNPVAATTTTDAAGFYQFTGLRPGTYQVNETQPSGYLDGKDTVGTAGGTVTNDQIAAIELEPNTNSTDNNFGELQAATVSGFVYVDADNDGVKDAGEAPIANTTVALSGTDVNNAAVNATTTTDAAGYYEFTGLMPGTYTVTETQPAGYLDGKDTAGSLGGSTTTNDVIATIVVPNAGNSTDNNFGELQAATVSGFVYVDADNDGVKDAGEAPIAGAAVSLSGTDVNNAPVTATTTTDAAGYYEFTGLMPGTYTVTETQPAGYLDGKDTAGSLGGSTATNDVIATIVVPNAGNSTDNNFGELQAATVSGFVYVDADNDGVKDAGEAPIAGATVTLSGTDVNNAAVTATTTTDAAGYY